MDPFTAAIRYLRKALTNAPYKYDYHGDHLAVRKKYVPFLHDAQFQETWDQTCHESAPHWIGGTPDIRWRVHVCLWAAECCLRLPGDFAEFGVNTGLLSTMILRNTEFDASGKKFFLFDTYDGIPEEMASETELAGVHKMNRNMYSGNPANVGIIDFCKKQFAPHPNAVLVPGLLPGSIDDVAFDALSYISIDLNITSAEIGTIEKVWDRITPGGIVVLDDYGLTGHEEQNAAWNAFATRAGRSIMALPTGQGVLMR
ncbi:MAG: TylF/MycF/NovP-related O-methyltransferase [Pseudomonadota bacterium]